MRFVKLFLGGLSLLLVVTSVANVAADQPCDQALCGVESALTLPSTLQELPAPVVETPNWMKLRATFTYSVQTRGIITADLAQFKQQANETLNDSRGWARLNIAFKEVATGGDFTLVLAQASYLPTFSSGCSVDYSCRAGRYVVINQDRWLGATSSWNSAGGSLRDYRHMVINHETGHWLGHDHEYCTGTGQSAPVMQQQSISLMGCSFNAWPLNSELWSSRL